MNRIYTPSFKFDDDPDKFVKLRNRMSVLKYDSTTGKWRKETKEEVMEKEDLEGKRPCNKCWRAARDYGVYVWPLTQDGSTNEPSFKRCKYCGRIIG